MHKHAGIHIHMDIHTHICIHIVQSKYTCTIRNRNTNTYNIRMNYLIYSYSIYWYLSSARTGMHYTFKTCTFTYKYHIHLHKLDSAFGNSTRSSQPWEKLTPRKTPVTHNFRFQGLVCWGNQFVFFWKTDPRLPTSSFDPLVIFTACFAVCYGKWMTGWWFGTSILFSH